MKKILILGGLVLFLALVVLLGCATVPIKSVTQADLPDLKGKWIGNYTTQGFSVDLPLALELDIFGEYLRGTMVWGQFEGGSKAYPYYGKLEKGRIVSSWESGYINLNLRKGEGKMKLEGDWQSGKWGGTMFLYKVKE
jgi:hypothetical protein